MKEKLLHKSLPSESDFFGRNECVGSKVTRDKETKIFENCSPIRGALLKVG